MKVFQSKGAGHEGLSLFREATLSVTDDEIQLGCEDDLGGSHDLGSLSQNSISRITIKKSVFTPGQQLMKPAMSGLGAGIMLSVFCWFITRDTRVVDSGKMIAISVGVVLGLVALFVVVNLGKVVWSHLAVVVFESNSDESLEVAIENEKADALVASFADRNVPVEPL